MYTFARCVWDCGFLGHVENSWYVLFNDRVVPICRNGRIGNVIMTIVPGSGIYAVLVS